MATAPSSARWEAIARLPESNHDIQAAILHDRVYTAGGLTELPGPPRRAHAFGEVWRFDPTTCAWDVAADLGRVRIYCACAAFLDRIWILGGDVLAPGGRRTPSTLVQVFDPARGTLEPGPDLPFAQPAPLALVAGGRLYVMGQADRTSAGRMDSLGPGEHAWRREPDGPPGMWALAGAVLNERLHVCVPQVGLACFDPALARWSVLGGLARPRSPQVAAWRGELWIAGGRDTTDGRATRIYTPATDTWRAGPSLPRDLAWGAAAVVNDRLLVVGGAGRDGYSDVTLALETPTVG